MNKCKNCGKILHRKRFKRCRDCYMIWRKDPKNNPNYGNRYAKIYKCIDCSKKITYQTWYYGSKKCNSCAFKGKKCNFYKNGYWLNKSLSKKHIEKISKENNHNWKGGISKLPYSFEFNDELKYKIRTRDSFECQNCGMTEEEHISVYGEVLSVHHIDYNKQNCKEINLITTCKQCNLRANKNRDYWYAYFIYIIENSVN